MTDVRGLTATQYGLMQLVYYWVVMLAEVPSGVFADRFGRRTTLALGAAVNGIGCWVFAISHDLTTFAIGEVLFALGTAAISGADSALLYDSLAADHREKDYPRAEGMGQAIWLILTAVGLPLTDLFLVRDGNPVLAYWITGALSLGGVAFALAMIEPPLKRTLSSREITLGAMRDVIRVPGLLRGIVYSIGLFMLLRAAIVTFLNPVLADLGVPVNRFGLVLAVVNVVGAVSALLAHRVLDRHGYRVAMWIMPLSLVAMIALLIPADQPIGASLFCIQGVVFGAYPLVVRSLLNRLAPSPERRATVLSLESMACRVSFGLLVVFSGWALDNHGLDWALAATAALACVPFLVLPILRRG